MIDLRITGIGTLAPYARLADFPTGPLVELAKPDLSLLERSLRRGLSDVTRFFMHVARSALADAGVAADEVHAIFGSAFGEIATAEAMLAQAFEENDASPARFRNSVHNTAPGLFSISVRNTLPSTALSAGWNTVAMSLLETQQLLDDGAHHVLLVLCEEPVPRSLSDELVYGPLAAAFVASRDPAFRCRARITGLQRAPHASGTLFSADDHPLAPALLLARTIEEGGQGSIVVGLGDPPYSVEVDASERVRDHAACSPNRAAPADDEEGGRA